MANYYLNFNNVSIEYYGGYKGCGNIDFSVEENNTVCIFGDRGSGKTSLLKAIGGLEEYTGSILLNGQELKMIPVKEREFALTTNNMPKNAKVFKILSYPLKLRKNAKSEIMAKVRDIAEAFDIFHLLQHSVSMLTPAQKVLVELARMFIVDRKLYLLDNPLEGVYITDRTKLAEEIIAKIKSLNKTVFYATDRIEEVSIMSPDKTILLCYNQMQDEGTLYQMAKRPRSVAAAKMLWQDMIAVIDGEIKSGAINIHGKRFKKPELIDDGFKDIKCVITYNDVSLTSSGDTAEVIAVYKSIEYVIIKVKADIGYLYIKDPSETNLIVGDSVYYRIDEDKILVYDSNSEKLILR